MRNERLTLGLITQWFDPETGAAAIPGVIARALVHDHDVEVLTAFPNYPTGRIFDGYKVAPHTKEMLGALKVHRVPSFPSHDDSALRRAFTWLSYAFTASTAASFCLGKCDAILVHMTPATVALPAMVLKLIRGVPYVLHVEDLWPDSIFASRQAPKVGGKTVRAVLNYMCDMTYRHASYVAVTSPGMASAIQARGVPASKLALVHNWTEEETFAAKLDAGEAKRVLGIEGQFTVMYAGNFGQFQELEVLVDAADAFREDSRITFLLVGTGVMENKLKAKVKDLGLNNVMFVAPRPLSEMGPIMAAGDLHYIALEGNPLFDMTIPSKLQATMSSGRPILAGLRGDAAKVVQDSKCGAVLPCGDGDALVSAIKHFLNDRRAAKEAGENGKRYYVEHMSMGVGSQMLIDLLGRAAIAD